MDEKGYWIVSYGADGRPDVSEPSMYPQGPAILLDADIVMKDGKIVQWPEGIGP